jgi:hypothetical protein
MDADLGETEKLKSEGGRGIIQQKQTKEQAKAEIPLGLPGGLFNPVRVDECGDGDPR